MIITIVIIYFALLVAISNYTSKNATKNTFYNGEKKSPWYLVAFGMIGASLSGVTFVSVPGTVCNQGFTYLQIALGNLIGYWFIAYFLIPRFYKMNLNSIYAFLENRLGIISEKTSAFFFIISKLLGASFRLFIVCVVLCSGMISQIPLWIVALVILIMIFLYTYKGGIKTIVKTDVLQTIFMLLSTIITIIIILQNTDISTLKIEEIKFLDLDVNSQTFFLKHFVSGIFLAIVMNGLDQDMMQKNLSCSSSKLASKNIKVFSVLQLIVVCLFLILGFLLNNYAQSKGLELYGDKLFPSLAFNHLGNLCSLVFLIGIISACFSSADSALTAMTTSFCIDFLKLDKQNQEEKEKKTRTKVHLSLMILMFLIIILFSSSNQSIVNLIFKTAGYTYGPILGIFAFSFFSKRNSLDKFVPYICAISVIICAILDFFVPKYTNYNFGFELLIINGLITFLGMMIFSKHTPNRYA